MSSLSGTQKHLLEVNIKDDEACSYALQLVSSSVLPMTLKASIELRLLEVLAAAGEGAKNYTKDAVMNGGVPFNKAHRGLMFFEYLEKDPRASNLFNEAMRGNSTIQLKKILESYTGFHSIGTVVDVGGGTGGTLSLITAKNPHIKGINFDMPHVISQAPALPGVEHIGGDMFDSIPRGDAIFMKSILHDWSDEDCLKILKNCWKALPAKGKVVNGDFIISETPDPSSASLCANHVDMIMFVQCPRGKERTKKEFKDLAMLSGFSGFTAVLSFANFWIMEFIK